ncbi:uncharacterized protein required for cytochrome oxidase assembly [Opitutaceae bacterium TAV1]|nr:uncharacterized protein required for cytochrome oxidase assembly [Opitutaceae bacterium TAV1]
MTDPTRTTHRHDPSAPLSRGASLPVTASDGTGRRTAGYQPGLAWFAAIGGFQVFVLVLLGAFTTSIGAGMIFPDWPLSNGSLNPAGWLSNVAMFAEHSHRLSAGLMSLITLALALWLWRREARPWLRRLGYLAVALVFAQALLGGLRVLLDHLHIDAIETSVGRLFAMGHACLAQIYVCVLLAIALSLSRAWIDAAGGRDGKDERDRQDAGDEATRTPGWRRAGVFCCVLLLAQLGVAAVMRHSFAGLAIPVFPHSTPEGGWLPAAWDFRVGIHFAHRVLALALTISLAVLVVRIWLDRAASAGVRIAAGAVVALVALQVTLGALSVLTYRNPHYTTAHVIVGALLLATTFGLTWWSWRPAGGSDPVSLAGAGHQAASPGDAPRRRSGRDAAAPSPSA